MRYEKKALFPQGLISFISAIAQFNPKIIAKYALGAIATITIVESSVVSHPLLANPTQEQAIALQIDNLKQTNQRWIEIDLEQQHLFAWDGHNQAFTAIISTGKAETPTYPGIYTIQRKYATDRMRGADYDLPNVPSVLYFDRGYALHGANWHNQFGTPISHGCINLPLGNAEWLFNWAKIGTTVVIHQ